MMQGVATVRLTIRLLISLHDDAAPATEDEASSHVKLQTAVGARDRKTFARVHDEPLYLSDLERATTDPQLNTPCINRTVCTFSPNSSDQCHIVVCFPPVGRHDTADGTILVPVFFERQISSLLSHFTALWL